MPTKNQYSYKNNKNNFSEVLDAMSNLDNVSAYNDNQCISKLGEMWDTCDKNIVIDVNLEYWKHLKNLKKMIVVV